MKGRKAFYRKAILKKFPEQEIIKYPTPPTKPENNNLALQLAMSIAPMAIMLGISVFTWIKTGSFPMYMLMFLAMVILQPINAVYNRNKSKKRFNLEVESWKEKIRNLDVKFETINQECKRELEQCFRSPDDYKKIAENCDEFLWSTMNSHNDFAYARLGVYDGTFITPDLSGAPMVVDESIKKEWEECERKERNPYIENTPFVYNFIKNGSLGVCGDKSLRYQAIAGLVIGMAIRQGYDIFHIALITNPDNLEQNFEYIKWLPHIWSNDNTRRLIALNEQDLTYIHNEIKIFSKAQATVKKKEFMLCIVDDKSYMMKSEIFSLARDNSLSECLSFVFIEDQKSLIPSVCPNIMSVTSSVKASYFDSTNMTYDAEDNLCGTNLTPDLITESNAETIARILAGIKIEDSSNNTDIPSSISFLKAMNSNSVNDLNIPYKWKNTYASNGAVGLIGTTGPGENLYTDFSDGINMHMIVTGTSGSGKSQFLTSMILSMMVNYSPDEVNFVFMDFKGNAFSSLFAYNDHKKGELLYPQHIVGSISNIESGGNREITRIRVMLQREISKREGILSRATNNGTIKEAEIKLYQKACRAGKIKAEPLPILVVVIDEFVELIENHKDVITELNTIARKGRSIGIHLVLSSQKISGKLPAQISANANARICFRVLEVSDSNEMIGKPDAALINPKLFGRGYAKLGGTIKQFQTPWSGMRYEERSSNTGLYDVDSYGFLSILDEDYHNISIIAQDMMLNPTNVQKKNELISIIDSLESELKDTASLRNISKVLFDIQEAIKYTDDQLSDKISNVCEEIEVRLNITELQEVIRVLVSQSGFKRSKIITSSLPDQINNTDLIKQFRSTRDERVLQMLSQKKMFPPILIGLSDNIYTQSHDLAFFDLLKGNCIVQGLEGSGKTHFISLIIKNMCYFIKSNQWVNIYLCDLQGRELDVFSKLPQVSRTIINDAEKVIRLAYRLRLLIDERKALYGATYNNWQNYCEHEIRIPAVVVFIDNYDYIAENCLYALEELLPIMEEGKKYGIFFIIATVGKTSGMLSSKYPSFQNKIVFMQEKDSDYSSILPLKDIKSIQRVKGRCFISESTVLETQVAYEPFDCNEESVKKISDEAKCKTIREYLPERIDSLMASIDVNSMVKRCTKDKINGRLFIGLDCLTVLPFYFDLLSTSYFAVTSDSVEVRRLFIKNLISLNLKLKQFSESDIVLISSDNSFSDLGCKYVNLVDYADEENMRKLLFELSDSHHIVITDDLTKTALAMSKINKKGVYDLFRDYLRDLYSHQKSGCWINSITNSSLARGTDFGNTAIYIQDFANQLISPSNILIQLTYKNDDIRTTPRAIDKSCIGRILPYNQAWLRVEGLNHRILLPE